MQISIIIPVWKEKKIMHLLRDIQKKVPRGAVELIVVDGDPHGGTINLITDPAVRKITGPKGRARQQNCGAAGANGQIFLFLHADTRLPRNFHHLIIQTILSGYAGGAFDLHIDSGHPLLKIISRVAGMRSRLTGIPYGDQAIFVTRALFYRINGFPDIPLMEDIGLMQQIKRDRGKFRILSAKAVTSARMWHQKGVVFTMIRNPLLALLFYLGVPPRILVKFYYKKWNNAYGQATDTLHKIPGTRQGENPPGPENRP